MDNVCQEQILTLGHCRSSKEAFEAIVRKYMKEAYFIALGLVGNRDDALDLSQEAFVRAYTNLHRFDAQRDFFPWFYQILRNLCFSHLRKKRVRSKFKEQERASGAGVSTEAISFDPSLVAQRNETSDKLWEAIGQLDDKHREVIILRHFQHLSYEEISRALSCKKGTVTSRLYHARNKLKEILESYTLKGSKCPRIKP
ncbi:MAG: RNA polymerase sigma factor [Planctomycetota bacterium]